MTRDEIRSLCSTYYDFTRILSHGGTDLPEEYRNTLCRLMTHAEWECSYFCESHPLLRWSQSVVGSVLAAAVWVSLDERRGIASATSLMRIFGLAGEHALSAYRAWGLVRPYAHEPVLSQQSVGEILRSANLCSIVVPTSPTPLDILECLTKHRQGEFQVWVGRWLVNYFWERPDAKGEFHEAYRSALANIQASNSSGNIATSIGKLTGHPTRADWAELLAGRLPAAWLETRAGQTAARKFLSVYWEKWSAAVEPKANVTA